MHEFEALLFSDCARFSGVIDVQSWKPVFNRFANGLESQKKSTILKYRALQKNHATDARI